MWLCGGAQLTTVLSLGFLCSQQVKFHAAYPLSVSPAGKSLSYSAHVQKFHLTSLNTSAFKPQSSCSCFSPGFLCPLTWKCHSAKLMWDVHPFFNWALYSSVPSFTESLPYLSRNSIHCLFSYLLQAPARPLATRQYLTEFDSLEEPCLSSSTEKGFKIYRSKGRIL